MLIDVVDIPSDPDGDLDIMEDLRCPPMEIEDLELDRVLIKDESRSDRCSLVGTKSVVIDKFKCNQGRPRCKKSDTFATTMTTSATTKFHGNTYMLLHLEARKEVIAPYVCNNAPRNLQPKSDVAILPFRSNQR